MVWFSEQKMKSDRMSLLLGLIALWTGHAEAEPLHIYQRDFQGDFARVGMCDRTAERWQFRERNVVQGPVWCELSEVKAQGGLTLITTRGCTEEGAPIPPRTYRLDLMSENVIKAQVGETTALLERCEAE